MGTAQTGRCSVESGCLLWLFLVLVSFNTCVKFFAAVPATHLLMRCVPPSHTALSLAINSIATRVLGSIPGPPTLFCPHFPLHLTYLCFIIVCYFISSTIFDGLALLISFRFGATHLLIFSRCFLSYLIFTSIFGLSIRSHDICMYVVFCFMLASQSSDVIVLSTSPTEKFSKIGNAPK